MRKLLGFIRDRWFIVLFFGTMLLPVYGNLIDRNITLNGVTESAGNPEVTVEGLMDGSSQTMLNNAWENEFPGRKGLIKLRSQMLYSVFKESPNANVVIGKNGYLYEPIYILNSLMANGPYGDGSYYRELGEKLGRLRDLLAANGKELYVFITPSKARICRAEIPGRYEVLDSVEELGFTDYSRLIEALDENGILYYDSISFLEENMNSGLLAAPVFYATGTHWSQSWGDTCASGLLDMMRKNSRYDLSTVKVTESVSPQAVFPATDLYDTLNLITKAEDDWYNAELTMDREGADKPTFLARGGSFMGQSVSNLIWAGVFGNDVYFENYYYFRNRFTENVYISGFQAYDEVDVDSFVGQSDIVLLEVNENNVWGMSFGFIDYLLEHPEYADEVYPENT